MQDFRELNNNDMLQQLMDAREEIICDKINSNYEKLDTNFNEFLEKILDRVPKKDKEKMRKLLISLDDSFTKSFTYYSSIYYRNGFVDGVQMILGCISKG